MEFRPLSAFIVFLGSYLPLALILAVQDISFSWWAQPICNYRDIESCIFNPFSNSELAVGFLIITMLAIMIANITLNKISFPHPATIKKSKSIPNDIINYVFPYVVSFMGISYAEPEKLLGFSVFLLWMFAITYKSGQIIMNPLLLMFGWKLYDAEIEIDNERRDVRILAKGNLITGEIKVQKIQDFYIARSNDDS